MIVSTLLRSRLIAVGQGRCLPRLTSLQSKNAKLLAPISAASRFMSSSHENHSKTWTIERILSGALIGLAPVGFITPIPGLDYALAAALVIHVHWGLEAVVVDYIRPSIFGPVIPKVSLGLLYLLSILSIGGLFYFNYTDVGLVNGMKMAWQKL